MKYTVKKGRHRARPLRLGLYRRRVYRFAFKFSPSCIYDAGPNQLDIQKLVGIRYLSFTEFSARFGWRYNPKYGHAVELLAYVHDRDFVTKDDKEEPIGVVQIGIWTEGSIEVQDSRYVFRLGSINPITVNIPKTHNLTWCFAQGVYFECADDIAAFHDMHIEIKKL